MTKWKPPSWQRGEEKCLAHDGSRCASTKLCTLALGNTMFSPIKTLSSGLTATLLRDCFAARHSWAALKQAGHIFKMHSPLVFHGCA